MGGENEAEDAYKVHKKIISSFRIVCDFSTALVLVEQSVRLWVADRLVERGQKGRVEKEIHCD